MSEISQITLPSGTTYDIKDATARQAMAGGVTFLGVSSTAVTDGGTEKPTINSTAVTPSNGDLVVYGDGEFIYGGTYGSGGTWAEFGDLSTLGDLAYKDTASGTVAVPNTYTTTVTPTTTTKYVASSATGGGTASKSTVTVSPASSGTATYTPAGNISLTINGQETGGDAFTPAGTVSTPTITVTPSTVTKYVAGSATGGGSVTAGTAASCTLPSFTATVSGETLTLGWSAGSFSANTPTSVTLPSFSSQTIATGISSATSTQPSFTGTEKYIHSSFSGTGVRLKTDSEVYTTVTMPSFSSQTIASGITSASTTTATTENKTVTVS